ncbi:MAG: VOC family protein [Gammaproteobacteria bacterium]|nr:VOC family protein [Gammaproteobacteria bacterium]
MTPGIHLCFNGCCREAFDFYRALFGGEIITLMSYGESPLAADTDTRFHEYIIHASLRFDGGEIAGADLLPDAYQPPRGFFVLMSIDSLARARDIFAGLADGGSIRMPLQPTFWSPGFGVVTDRFGIPWEISCADAK